MTLIERAAQPCCMEQACRRNYPSPVRSQAIRTEIGRPIGVVQNPPFLGYRRRAETTDL